MDYENAILPTEDQVKALMESDVSGPIVRAAGLQGQLLIQTSPI